MQPTNLKMAFILLSALIQTGGGEKGGTHLLFEDTRTRISRGTGDMSVPLSPIHDIRGGQGYQVPRLTLCLDYISPSLSSVTWTTGLLVITQGMKTFSEMLRIPHLLFGNLTKLIYPFPKDKINTFVFATMLFSRISRDQEALKHTASAAEVTAGRASLVSDMWSHITPTHSPSFPQEITDLAFKIHPVRGAAEGAGIAMRRESSKPLLQRGRAQLSSSFCK